MILYDKKAMPVALVGGKGYGLCKLVAYGFDVPDFFVVCAGTDLYSPRFLEELSEYATRLGEPFAVRSSNVNEDGEESSFAGQYSTETNVSSVELVYAIRRVAASCNNAEIAAYSKSFAVAAGDMAVIVQKQVTGANRISGVMFSATAGEPDSVTVESVIGDGESLVGGRQTPTRMTFSKSEEAPIDGMYGTLAKAAAELEKREGAPVDVEWAFADGKLWFLQLRPLTALGDNMPMPETTGGDKWEFYVYRDFCEFAHSVQKEASLSELQEALFGFSVPIYAGILVNGREFYTQSNNARQNEIWRALHEKGKLQSFAEQVMCTARRARRTAAAIKKLDCSALSDPELCKLYCKLIRQYTESYVPMMMRPDDYLAQALAESVGDDEAKRITSTVMSSGKTYYSSENADFLNAVIDDEKKSEYLDKYEWFVSPLGKRFLPMTAAELDRRAARISKSEAIARLNKLKAERRKTARAVLSESDESVRQLLNLIQTFVFLRTFAAENSDRFFYYFRKNVLAEICRRAGITEAEFAVMTAAEFTAACRMGELPKPPSPSEVKRRESGVAVIWTDGVPRTYYGQQSYAILKRLNGDIDTDTKPGAVVGDIACYGEAVGKVKVVKDHSEIYKIEKGDILVATMTTPEVTGALDLAAGIITDEGGITCHAAIIAREYALPCLVGTRNATAVLRDGMTVKLDCINGRAVIVE